ncbi:hypothetical protein D3C77_672330 [compost metagenome]
MNEELLEVLTEVMQKFASELNAVQTSNSQIQNSLATILNSTLQANAKPKDDEFAGYSLNPVDGK